MPQLGFVILYTPDVSAKMAFYEKAFGLARKYLAKDEVYGEMAGTIPLGFVQEAFAESNGTGFAPSRPGGKPGAFEIGFVTDDVAAAFARAVDAGCAAVVEPVEKPWGQTIAYVRDDDGVLVEICTPWSV
jgi:catechol 2,3-dioxygenase-like lactoylglutathione lyase family enzyme